MARLSESVVLQLVSDGVAVLVDTDSGREVKLGIDQAHVGALLGEIGECDGTFRGFTLAPNELQLMVFYIGYFYACDAWCVE